MKHENGFSLLELIIYVGIFAVVSAVFVDMVFSLNLGWTKSKVESEVQQNLRFAHERITEDIRRATAVTAPAVGATGSTLTLTAGGQTVQYALSGTVLQRQAGADPAENITADTVKVTGLSFRTAVNTAASNSAVQATSTQFVVRVEYNATEPQFAYAQTATSTERLRQ